MTITLKFKTYTAKKEHFCNASEQIFNSLNIDDFTKEEQIIINKHKLNNFKIMPGDKYIYCAIVNDGDFGIFKAIPDMYDLYYKYKVYED